MSGLVLVSDDTMKVYLGGLGFRVRVGVVVGSYGMSSEIEW